MTKAMKGKTSGNGRKATARPMPLGNASVATRAEVPKYVVSKRHVWQLIAEPLVTENITSNSQGALPLGNQFADIGLGYSLRSFYESGDPTLEAYDQFRIINIDVYAEQAYEGPGIDLAKSVYVSVDHDEVGTPTWRELQSRDNVALAVIRNNNPRQLIASWKPVANFINNPTASSPVNIIPSANCWFDMSAVGQTFNGLKVHIEAPGGTVTSLRFHARAHLELRGKI